MSLSVPSLFHLISRGSSLKRFSTARSLHDYEADWLTLLLKMGVVSEKALQAASSWSLQQF